MTQKAQQTPLKSGYYFSPGFYMGYWLNCIERYYSHEVIKSHIALKQHREMWVGAILAAWQTKATGVKHYVGLPAGEPPDVELARFIPSTHKGKESLDMQKIGYELIRCSLDEGEKLIDHIKKKNLPAYEGMSVAILFYGSTDINTTQLQKEVEGLGKIYPHDIVLVGPVLKTESETLPVGSFGISHLYPSPTRGFVNLFDQEVFFIKPAIKAVVGRGVTRKIKNLGSIELMPPEITPNIYLDIDGVILANDKNGANYVHEFLEHITTSYPDSTYWLTTHCQGNAQTAIGRLREVLKPETIELLSNIKPTRWDTTKTEAIDFTKPFLWFDDDLYDDEREELEKHGVLSSWIEVDLAKDENQLKELMELL